jgi:hypothetical protein
MTEVDDFTFSDGLNPGRKQARLACVFGGLKCMLFSIQTTAVFLISVFFSLLPYKGIEMEEIVCCSLVFFAAAALLAALMAAPVYPSVQVLLLP